MGVSRSAERETHGQWAVVGPLGPSWTRYIGFPIYWLSNIRPGRPGPARPGRPGRTRYILGFQYMGERRLFRYVALCIGGDFSATRANYTSDVEFALGLPWRCAANVVEVCKRTENAALGFLLLCQPCWRAHWAVLEATLAIFTVLEGTLGRLGGITTICRGAVLGRLGGFWAVAHHRAFNAVSVAAPL